jgi:hypothetical protein
MPAPDFIALFTEPLNRLGRPYMITGATAAIVYGQPRLTNDLDAVIEIRVADIEPLRAAFPESEFYVPPAEAIATEIARLQRAHFNLIHLETGYKADFYPAGTDPLHRWAMPRRRQFDHGGSRISIAPPEYVILRKLEYFREGGSPKHPSDIAAMLRISGGQIDRAFIRDQAAQRGLNELWSRVEGDV